MGETYRYDAFISYRHVEPDRKWAKWLHKALETFKTPKVLVKKGIAPRIKRVFRDEDELPASADLSTEIDTALTQSRFLIVVCSPRTPESEWVNQEVVRFREMGRHDKILALLIEGEPAESFPRALCEIRTEITDEHGEVREHIEDVEPLAADVREGRDEATGFLKRMALLRSAAALLGCRFDDLRRRQAERRKRVLVSVGAGLAALVVGLTGLTVYALKAKDEAEVARVEADEARLGEKAAKERAIADGVRLADLSALGRVLVAAENLFPASPGDVAEGMRVLSEAEAAIVRIPDHRDEHDRLASRNSAKDKGSLRLLQDIARDGKRVTSGALETLASRFKPSAEWNDEGLWQAAITAIQDERANPIYGGYKVPGPQFGLLPVAQDPHSRLFEFAHVYSGDVPKRDPASGEIVKIDDMGVVFVLIPGGTFWRGATKEAGRNHDEHADSDEAPPHEVTLSPFFVAKYECTQAQWARLTGGEQPSWSFKRVDGFSALNPVEHVSWGDCAGKPGWLVGYGLELPSEAQWEYACRAPFDARGARDDAYTPWSGVADEKLLLDVAWTEANSGGRRHPVGEKAANRFGLHDMHGNVMEWCQDWHGGEYYKVLARSSTADRTDPAGPEGSGDRVTRGGSWVLSAKTARSADRTWSTPGMRTFYTGFRPARSVTSD